MKITILCSSEDHPINNWLIIWANEQSSQHEIDIIKSKNRLSHGDLLFLISCSEIIPEESREKYRKVLVVHASDLPHGRGWSPHIWNILEGQTRCTVTLLEAENNIDTGDIWQKDSFDIPKSALLEEINALLFSCEIKLMDFAVENFDNIQPIPQSKNGSTYHPKRTPANSKIDPQQTIAAQFDLLRVCDPIRYPAYFELHGHKYKITLDKLDDE